MTTGTKLLIGLAIALTVVNVALAIFAPAPTAKVTVTIRQPVCPASAPAQFYPTPTGSLPYAQLLTRP